MDDSVEPCTVRARAQGCSASALAGPELLVDPRLEVGQQAQPVVDLVRRGIDPVYLDKELVWAVVVECNQPVADLQRPPCADIEAADNPSVIGRLVGGPVEINGLDG